MMAYKHPAAFINAIAQRRDFDEALRHLQETWNELCDLKSAPLSHVQLAAARSALEPFRQEAELILKDAGRGMLSDGHLIGRAFTFKEWKQAAAVDAVKLQETEAPSDVVRLTRERDEARQLAVEANNSLYGSQGYFHSFGDAPFDKYHLANGIERLKQSANATLAQEPAGQSEAGAGRPELDALLKKATDAFSALPPEKQKEMLRQQRDSWVRGEMELAKGERSSAQSAVTAGSASPGVTGEVLHEARFLLDRLEEYDPEDEDHARDFYGHVVPSIARLSDLLAAHPTVKVSGDAAEMRERAAKVVEPEGPRPCACVACYCNSTYDRFHVEHWDADAAKAASIRALPITQEGRS